MIQIAQYRGISRLSKTIRLITYSDYSHTAARTTRPMTVYVKEKEFYLPAGVVIEAWTGGVRMVPNLSAQHTPGTRVDLMEFRQPLSEQEEERFMAFLIENLEKPYDYLNVGRFVPGVRLFIPTPAPEVWTRTHVFCSELIAQAAVRIRRHLQERMQAFKIHPGLVGCSPLLKMTDSIITT